MFKHAFVAADYLVGGPDRSWRGVDEMDELERFLAKANEFASVLNHGERVRFLEQGIARFPTDPRLFGSSAESVGPDRP